MSISESNSTLTYLGATTSTLYPSSSLCEAVSGAISSITEWKYLIRIRASGSPDHNGHAMAFLYDGSKYTFFDPNLGEVCFTDADDLINWLDEEQQEDGHLNYLIEYGYDAFNLSVYINTDEASAFLNKFYSMLSPEYLKKACMSPVMLNLISHSMFKSGVDFVSPYKYSTIAEVRNELRDCVRETDDLLIFFEKENIVYILFSYKQKNIFLQLDKSSGKIKSDDFEFNTSYAGVRYGLSKLYNDFTSQQNQIQQDPKPKLG